jgi:hypothetical protein
MDTRVQETQVSVSEQADWTPRPDPTLLTTAQLRQELGALREIIESRLDAMDRATELLSDTVNRTPTVIQTEISHLRELDNERFSGVTQRFSSTERTQERAEEATSRRFDGLAEWREGVSDQLADFPNRVEIRAQLDTMSTLIATLNGRVSSFVQELTISAEKYMTKEQFTAAEKGREAERKDGRRALTAAAVAIGIAIVGWVVIIAISLASHKTG